MVADGVTVAIRLTPKAKRAALQAEVIDAPAGPAFRASVTAPPSEGAANAALIALLAKSWRVPKSALTIIGGAKDRNKVVHLRGDPAALRATIEGWMAEQGMDG
jgi:hypothetical protein